jgi:hypothetical protein
VNFKAEASLPQLLNAGPRKLLSCHAELLAAWKRIPFFIEGARRTPMSEPFESALSSVEAEQHNLSHPTTVRISLENFKRKMGG